MIVVFLNICLNILIWNMKSLVIMYFSISTKDIVNYIPHIRLQCSGLNKVLQTFFCRSVTVFCFLFPDSTFCVSTPASHFPYSSSTDSASEGDLTFDMMEADEDVLTVFTPDLCKLSISNLITDFPFSTWRKVIIYSNMKQNEFRL